MSIPTTGATVTTALSQIGASTSPVTGSHTTDTNTNLLIVLVTYGFPTTTPHATNVTFDSVALTELGTIQQGNDARADIWYLKNPSIKTATVSVGSFGSGARLGWTAINVIGAGVSGTTFGTIQSLAAVATDLSVTLSSAADELILGAVVRGTFGGTLTIQTGVTELSNFIHLNKGIFATGKKTGAASVGFGFTSSSAVDGVCIAIPIKPVSTGAIHDLYGWRVRNDAGGEGTGLGAWLAAEDTAISIGSTGEVDLNTNFRLRFGLDELNQGVPVTPAAIRLRAKLNGGVAFDVTGTSSVARMSLSAQFAEGDATTDHGLAVPPGTFNAGEMSETDGLTNPISIAQNAYTILEYCLQARVDDLANEDTLEFGIQMNGIDYFPGAITATIQPLKPANVATGIITTVTIPLSWTDPNSPDIQIRPYYKRSIDSTWIPEGTLPAGTTSWTFGDITPLVPATEYDVGVSTWDGSLESIIAFVTDTTVGSGVSQTITGVTATMQIVGVEANITIIDPTRNPPTGGGGGIRVVIRGC